MKRIRLLTPQEVPDAYNLIREARMNDSEADAEISREQAEETVKRIADYRQPVQFLGCYEGCLEGVLAFTDEGEVILFAVRPQLRKQGIEAALFQKLREHLTHRSAARISAHAAGETVSFYEGLGFETVREDAKLKTAEMEYLLGRDALGRTVTVTVDRTIGSFHPLYADTQYPCNYGYVEEVLAADGEFQDAYIVGVYEPVDTFTGIVTAIIYRRDDCESKWVVTPDRNVSHEEVIRTVGEIEQYFDTRILWLNPDQGLPC